MSASDGPEGLTEEQIEVRRQAALLVIKARTDAAILLRRAGVEDGPDPGGFMGQCVAVLRPETPGRPQVCGCGGYVGAGDECFGRWEDFTGPDWGAGGVMRICGHSMEHHVSM